MWECMPNLLAGGLLHHLNVVCSPHSRINPTMMCPCSPTHTVSLCILPINGHDRYKIPPHGWQYPQDLQKDVRSNQCLPNFLNTCKVRAQHPKICSCSWMDAHLLWTAWPLESPQRGIHQAAVNSFGYIAKKSGPPGCVILLLTNLWFQEWQSRVCSTVAIAIVTEMCGPFTCILSILNEYWTAELNVHTGCLKALSFVFKYVSSQSAYYCNSVVTMLEMFSLTHLISTLVFCTTLLYFKPALIVSMGSFQCTILVIPHIHTISHSLVKWTHLQLRFKSVNNHITPFYPWAPCLCLIHIVSISYSFPSIARYSHT